MGYIAHEAAIAVIYDEDRGAADALEAFRNGLPIEHRHLVIGPVHMANIYTSWAFMPDGSKEGWAMSDAMAAARAVFVAIGRRYGDVAAVRFGGDFEMEFGSPVLTAGR